MAIGLGDASPLAGGAPDEDEFRRQLAEANLAARELAAKTLAARERGNALTELEVLRAMEEEFTARGEMPMQVIAQELATLYSRLGNYAEAIRYADRASGPPSFEAAPPLEGFVPRDAVEVLAEVGDTSQVIMVNEAHHVPQHRALTLRLLEALRRKGFSFLAVETLFSEDTALNDRGYPTSLTGAYSSEPVYGDLIRTALRLGYRVVAYESPGGGSVENRERGQAANLMERILRDNPKAKLLVHAGYSHINESGTLAGARPMAMHFRELTGIDPFTVDQTTMTEHSRPSFEHPFYRSVLDHRRFHDAKLFHLKGRVWTAAPGKHDATVFHPRSRYRAGRPDWLRLAGARAEVQLPRKLFERGQRYLVYATYAGEGRDAVPVDQVEVAPGRPLPVLLLPPGSFLVRVEDGTGRPVATLCADSLNRAAPR